MIRYMLTNQLARQIMETQMFTPEFMYQFLILRRLMY